MWGGGGGELKKRYKQKARGLWGVGGEGGKQSGCQSNQAGGGGGGGGE